MYARVQKAVRFLRGRAAAPPSVAVVLGSGLGTLAREVEGARVIPYAAIPHFPTSTVEGHASQIVFGYLQDKPVAVMQGRCHYYEGYSMQEVTFPVRVLRALGVTTLILTNSAGGLHPNFRVGDLMLIRVPRFFRRVLALPRKRRSDSTATWRGRTNNAMPTPVPSRPDLAKTRPMHRQRFSRQASTRAENLNRARV